MRCVVRRWWRGVLLAREQAAHDEEEHRNEEDAQQGREDHAAEHGRADSLTTCGARAEGACCAQGWPVNAATDEKAGSDFAVQNRAIMAPSHRFKSDRLTPACRNGTLQALLQSSPDTLQMTHQPSRDRRAPPTARLSC